MTEQTAEHTAEQMTEHATDQASAPTPESVTGETRTLRPLLNLLPGIPAADVCGPDGCCSAD